MDKLAAFGETTHMLNHGNGKAGLVCIILYRDDIDYHRSEHLHLIQNITLYERYLDQLISLSNASLSTQYFQKAHPASHTHPNPREQL